MDLDLFQLVKLLHHYLLRYKDPCVFRKLYTNKEIIDILFNFDYTTARFSCPLFLYIFYLFLINIGNKETKHNKKSKVLTSQKKSLFEQKEKPWLLDWKKPSLVVWWCYLQLQYAFGMAAIICRLLYFVLFCLYLIVYTALNWSNNVLLLWTRYILIWGELSLIWLALILKRIWERQNVKSKVLLGLLL